MKRFSLTQMKSFFQTSSLGVMLVFLVQTFLPIYNVQAQTAVNLPAPGVPLGLSQPYAPELLKGMTFYPDNPLQFEFLLDLGDANFLEGPDLREQGVNLIKYFLAALTVPEEEMWVNLSPYEGNLIIPDSLGDTTMGRDLLAQDYLLKQLTASLMAPEGEIGQAFWDRVYEKAYALYKKTDIPINTFNKIWIVPESATILEQDNNVYLLDGRLRVLLEEDYVALKENMGREKFGTEKVEMDDATVISNLTTELIREIIIPEIEQEVNHGQTFAQLRQIYYAMVLATWYKENLKETLLSQVYVDKAKTKGVDTWDKQVTEKIYQQYIAAFEKGVQNLIQDDYIAKDESLISRKYFAGGFTLQRWDGKDLASLTRKVNIQSLRNARPLTRAKVRDWLDEASDGDLFRLSLALIEYTENNEYTMEDVIDAGFFDNVIEEHHAQRLDLMKDAGITPFMLNVPLDQEIEYEDGTRGVISKEDLITFGQRFRTGIETIAKKTHRDKLTGLYNLDGYMLRLQEMIDWLRRQGDPNDNLQYVFFDIDHFKAVNDTFGHDNGDVVLQQFAELLTQNVRATSTVARIGGEEFLILMFDKSAGDAYAVMQRIQKVFQEHYQEQISKEEPFFIYDKEKMLRMAKRRMRKLLTAKKNNEAVDFDISKIRDALIHQVKVQGETKDFAQRDFADYLSTQNVPLFNEDLTAIHPEFEKALEMLEGWMITFSAGITLYDKELFDEMYENDPQRALGEIATLLYRQGNAAVEVAKTSGRNKVVVYNPDTMPIDESRKISDYPSPAPLYESVDMTKIPRKRLLQHVQGLRKRFMTLINKSETDPLTNVKNRNGLYQKFLERVSYGQRYQRDTSVALAYTDIDFFKTINDSFGHEIGDNVLKAVTKGFKEYLRTVDTVSRFGGEEIVIFMPAMKLNSEMTLIKLKDLMKKVRGYVRSQVALFDDPEQVKEKIMSRVDDLMESVSKGINVSADITNLRAGLVHQLTVQGAITSEEEKRALLDDPSPDSLYQMAARLNGWDVTLSAGAVREDYSPDGKLLYYLKRGDLDTGLQTFIGQAEIAAGYVKETGRNRVEFYSDIKDKRKAAKPVPEILVVESDERVSDGLKQYFEQRRYKITTVPSLERAEQELELKPRRYSMVITRDKVQDASGTEVVEKLREMFPGLKSFVLAGTEVFDVDYIEEMIAGAIGKPDLAMLTEERERETPVGGIDLDPALLTLTIKRDASGVPLPVPQQPPEAMQIEGFIPVITDIIPVHTLPILTGLQDREDTLAQL